MKDCVLIQHGRAHEIFTGVTLDRLPPLHIDLLREMVEVEAGSVKCGDVFDGVRFVKEVTDPKSAAMAELRAGDLQMARAVEDLIDVLISRKVIAESDLPAGVIERMTARRALRTKLKD